MNTLRGQLPELERSIFGIERELSPQEHELQAQLYEMFAPRYAGAELENLRGAGGQIARESDSIAREIDPEYYQTRARSSELLQELMQGGLTGGEQTSIERGLRSSGVDRGLDNSPSGTEQFRHAIEFGGAARDRLGQALAMATQSLPSFRTSSGAQVQGQANQSLGNINNPLTRSSREGANALGQSADSFLNQQAQLQATQQQIDANRRTVSDHVGQAWQQSGLGGATSAAGGGCCFIFLESYNGLLPWFVRYWRDRYYAKDSQVSKGYILSAKALVPLMHRSSIISDLVNHFMVIPITEYGGYLSSVKGFEHGKHQVTYFKFWSKVWKFLGKF